MSLPDEQRRALDNAEVFLQRLLTRDWPSHAILRAWARSILRHYPSSVERQRFKMLGER